MERLVEYQEYAEQLGIQMRKGLLVYCVLVICDKGPACSADIITALARTSLIVVEGTMYPLLNRLQKDGLLTHEWRETSQGPPRKYYHMNEAGRKVLGELRGITQHLQTAIKDIEKDT